MINDLKEIEINATADLAMIVRFQREDGKSAVVRIECDPRRTIVSMEFGESSRNRCIWADNPQEQLWEEE
ncbi:MAG: hypothetical protein V3R83_09910 [Gammaproteobacteria bacterium]